VAMTRTIKELTISYANSRRIYNSLMPALPSRFIGEMVIEHSQNKVIEHSRNMVIEHSRNMVIEHSRNMVSKWFARITFDEQTLKDTSFYAHANKRTQYNWNTDHEKFRVGQRVSHPEFGKGIILSVRNEGELTKLTVSFDNGSLKKIIADYIKIL
jgi:DNA helicase-2/ATP-dependent DNA helicase PcrA